MQVLSDPCKSSQILNRGSSPKPESLITDLSLRSYNKYMHNNSSNLEENKISEFKFQYISKPELEAVVKRVRRARQKKKEEEEWKYFLQRREPRDRSACLKSTSTCSQCGLPEPSPTSSSFQQSQDDEEEIPKENRNTEALVRVHETEASGEDVTTSHTYQLSPGLVKRLQDLLTSVGKMTTLLLNPGLCAQHEDEDVDRTIKRSLEFDAMFARNHLYEIQRLLKDTKQLVRSANTVELETKIAAALKCVTQALQVYMKHVGKGSRIKYQQVVPIFQSITSTEVLLEHLTGRRLFPMRQELDVSCSYLKQLLLETSTTETKSTSVVSRKVLKDPRARKPSTDLSMYNRRGRDWRRKSAALARQRFGPPPYKKQQRIPESSTARRKLDEKLDKGAVKNGSAGEILTSKSYEKSVPSKTLANVKDVPFRNATRAVPEEQVTTMMEMIPHEPSDGSELCLGVTELCLGDSEFQTLKLLNGAQDPVQETKVVDSQPQEAMIRLSPAVSVPHCVSGSVVSESTETKCVPRRKESETSKTVSTKSSARTICNVQLVCLTEEDPPVNMSRSRAHAKSALPENERNTLTVERTTRDEAEEYRRRNTDYNNSNPNYKDGKAIGIVNRLTNQILTDMILDFQRDEVDQVVRILYNMEFE